MQTNTAGNFFGKRYISSASFLAAILLFLLPFVQIKCNDAPFAENTGIGLAFGTDYRVTGDMRSLQKTFEDKNDRPSGATRESGKQYLFALFALIFGVAGLVSSLLRGRFGHFTYLVGILGALCLLGLMIHLKMDVTDKTTDSLVGEDIGNRIKITATFSAWYWISLLCFLAAAFFSYNQRNGEGHVHEHPSGRAPQLDIENPGDQSEFPRSASESDIG